MNTTIETLARATKAAKIIKTASKSSTPEDYFHRDYDNLFEEGDGHEVYLHLGKMCLEDETLLASAKRVDHWINVERLLEVRKEYDEQYALTHPTLF